MRVKVLLGDAAQVDAGGKLYALGLGWTHTSTPVGQMGVAVLVDLDMEQEASGSHELVLGLFDDADALVEIPAVRTRFTIKLDFVPDAGVKVPVVVPFAVQLSAVPLDPNRVYVWRVTVDGNEDPSWATSFATDQIVL